MPETDFNIISFDPLTAPEALWTAHYDHLDEISRELDPDEPLVPRAKRRAMLVSAQNIPYSNRYYWLALGEGGEAAGYALAVTESPRSPSYESNKAVANLKLSVLPKYRRKGLGARLLKHLVNEMAVKEPAVKELLTPGMLEPGIKFLDWAGGKASLVQAENRLYLKDLDWAMVEAWAAGGARKNPSADLVTVTEIPEADIKEYCEIYSETINQQPLGDIAITMKVTPEQIRLGEEKEREAGAEHTTIYAKEAGAVTGLTEIYYMRETGHRVFQMLTGVRAASRGQGLGKLLKALMLLHIRAKYPGVKYIVTGNADSNAPMMAINTQLGFKKHRPVLIYKLKIADIRWPDPGTHT